MIAKWWGFSVPLALAIFGSLSPAYAQVASFVYSNGAYTSVDVPGSVETQALGISGSGQVVGTYFKNSQVDGFIYSEGAYQTLFGPDSSVSSPTFISDNGNIVGSSTSSSFEYDGLEYTILKVPGPTSTYPIQQDLMTMVR
jgi:hypothetical protein